MTPASFFVPMKLHFLFNLLLIATYCIGQETTVPKLKFQERTIKHKKVKAGENLHINYVFQNIGNAPLVIHNIKVNCSCTQPTWPTKPILPFSTDTIKVTVNTKSMISWQDRILLVYSNTFNSPDKIRFKVMVDNKDNH